MCKINKSCTFKIIITISSHLILITFGMCWMIRKLLSTMPSWGRLSLILILVASIQLRQWTDLKTNLCLFICLFKYYLKLKSVIRLVRSILTGYLNCLKMIKLGVYLLIYFLNKTDFSSGAAPFKNFGGPHLWCTQMVRVKISIILNDLFDDTIMYDKFQFVCI